MVQHQDEWLPGPQGTVLNDPEAEGPGWPGSGLSPENQPGTQPPLGSWCWACDSGGPPEDSALRWSSLGHPDPAHLSSCPWLGTPRRRCLLRSCSGTETPPRSGSPGRGTGVRPGQAGPKRCRRSKADPRGPGAVAQHLLLSPSASSCPLATDLKLRGREPSPACPALWRH